MKRFISFIFLILLCFIFLGFGVSFAAIESGIGQKIEQAGASLNLTEIETECFNATILTVLDNRYLTLRQSSGTFDKLTTIKNIRPKPYSTIKADGTIAPEIGTVLKGPIMGPYEI